MGYEPTTLLLPGHVNDPDKLFSVKRLFDAYQTQLITLVINH